MDEVVRAAIARWPDVPAVYGWLGLSARGDWRLRGEPIGNAAIRAFIGRNYAADEDGNWFFQNGPQRVFVELELTPWIARLNEGALLAHTGVALAEVERVFADEAARFYFVGAQGAAALDDRDVLAFSSHLIDAVGAPVSEALLSAWQSGRGELYLAPPLAAQVRLPIERIAAAEVPQRLGFRRRPQPPAS